MADFKNLFNELLDIDDNMEKYQWIIDYGVNAEPLDHKYRTDANMVKGCTSILWVVKEDDRLLAHGTSHIVNGIANMICDYYNQASEEQRQSLTVGLLNDLGLAPLLSMGRQNGVANLINTIKRL